MENISTAFLFVNKGKLRHNLGRLSRSDFVQLEFVLIFLSLESISRVQVNESCDQGNRKQCLPDPNQ